MSKLYLSEKGHVVPSLCEELTSFRHARKTLYLPPTDAPGILYLLARPHADAERPLRLAVNGEEIESIRPGPTGGYQWYQTTIDFAILEMVQKLFSVIQGELPVCCWNNESKHGGKPPYYLLSSHQNRYVLIDN